MLPEQAQQGATINLSVATPGNSRPFVLILGDAPGPTIVPDFPTFQVGGNIGLFTGTTDAAGNFATTFAAPAVPSAVGVLYYSQVLTFDASFTGWAVSNAHINLFTQ
jgi:hypothetical protein